MNGGVFSNRPAPGVTATIDFPPITELPGTQIGPYKLLEQIGEGGMGVVYHASQREPIRRTVALKIIKPGMDTREVVTRFEAERQALALMDHPNIAKVFDGGVTDAGRPYFVMELVKGKPITEYCDREQLSTRERLALFVAVCQGVQHAHQKGIIHRDLKPSNLLIKVYDVRPVPMVIDFGIAKAMGQQLSEQSLHTAFDQMVGTPLYMSPEQAGQSGLDVDTRSDIYSLGVLLYELLTGHTPFERDTLRTAGVDEMRRIIREVDPPRPSVRVSTLEAADLSTISERRQIEPHKLSQQLRGELDWIVMKAMDKDRDRRYATVNDLAADVERYLNDEPVQACPPSIRYRLLKSVRRYKVAAVVTAVVTSTILASAAFSAWKYVDERAARQDSDEQKLVAVGMRRRRKTRRPRRPGRGSKQFTRRQKRGTARRRSPEPVLRGYRLAYVDIGQGNTSRARDNLLFHFPDQGEADRRGWEWYYLLGRSHEADQALYGHGRQSGVLPGVLMETTSHRPALDGSARVWDAKTGKQLRCFDQGPTIKCGIGWSPDSRKLAWGSCSDESALRVWNRDTDEIAVVHGHQGSIWAVAWSHDGKYVATGSIHLPSDDQPGNVRIWDMEKLESIAQFTSAHQPESVSWSPDDKLLAVSSKLDGHIIWDVASQRQLPDMVMELARWLLGTRPISNWPLAMISAIV